MKISGIIGMFIYFLPSILSAQTDTARSSDSLPAETPPQQEETVNDPDSVVYFQRSVKWAPDSFVQQRRIPDSIVNGQQADKDFWYANATIKKKKESQQGVKSSRLGPLLWILIILVFTGFLAWYLYSNVFAKRNARLGESPQTVTEEIPENIFEINFPLAINTAEEKKNYRLATRLRYLDTIRRLAEKNLITYSQGKTNFDYIMQLQSMVFYDSFFSLTRIFEYCWYGQFELDETLYARIRNDFLRFQEKLTVSA
jgi:hypothetical protein